MIEHILEHVAALPEDLHQIFNDIYYANTSHGQAIPPPEMEAWVVRQFGALEPVRAQTIVNVTNRLTLESALFNPLRARRPLAGPADDAELETWIARELAAHDIFRDPERDTTADVFGRVRGRHCVTASNVAKYEGWHGLVIFDEPHPLRFGAEQLADYLATALRWLAAAHAQDSAAIFPLITWNCLPKSGATIVHGHMQIALAHGMHYARVELWRAAAARYRAATGRDYFGDLYALHEAFGLTLPHADVRAFAHLTPLRNREVVLLAGCDTGESNGRAGAGANERFIASSPHHSIVPPTLGNLPVALYRVLRALIDKQGMRAFNLAIALPPLGPAEADWSNFPIVARLGDRGNPLSERGDIGAIELYASGCITADPFEVAGSLREMQS